MYEQRSYPDQLFPESKINVSYAKVGLKHSMFPT